jgi:hypothetical protein
LPFKKARCVVDTNVPLVASDRSGMSPECVHACSLRLQELMQSGCVVIDDKWLILGEYQHKLSPLGQPKIGDRFLKWILTNLANPQRCHQVTLTHLDDSDQNFAEFPAHSGLARFDPSDRKFVAVAAACPDGPAPILQAADSKWWGWSHSLAECGIRVDFICPAEISSKHKKKTGP